MTRKGNKSQIDPAKSTIKHKGTKLNEKKIIIVYMNNSMKKRKYLV